MSIYLQFEIFLKNQKGVVKYDYRDVEGAVPYDYLKKMPYMQNISIICTALLNKQAKSGTFLLKLKMYYVLP